MTSSQPDLPTGTAAPDGLLWTPLQVGDLHLPHRLAMAPMTRDRSQPDGVPTPMNATYYAQRASLALIISEGTQPSADGQGYLLTPGVHTAEQADGWRQVADAVHAAGGRLVIQLMHVGRVSHPANTPHGRQPVAPSAVTPAGVMFTMTGPQPMPEPRPLLTDEITGIVEEFRHAAATAVAAGADGVEIHAANGYLLHQFLSSNANLRDDRYGGSVPNRIRLAVEVASAVAQEIGSGRTGIRISPGNPFNDITEHDVHELYPALVQALAPLGLAYLHVAHEGDEPLVDRLRSDWPGDLLLNRGGADLATRLRDLETGRADAITAGSMALANPDLVERIRTGAPLNDPDPATFYGGDDTGYTDYPVLARTANTLRTRIPPLVLVGGQRGRRHACPEHHGCRRHRTHESYPTCRHPNPHRGRTHADLRGTPKGADVNQAVPGGWTATQLRGRSRANNAQGAGKSGDEPDEQHARGRHPGVPGGRAGVVVGWSGAAATPFRNILPLAWASLDDRRPGVRLSPHEQERLLASYAAELARRRQARGLTLNHPEAVALITDHLMEGARDGRTVVELMSSGCEVLTRADVMDGVPEMLGEVQVEATFPDGTKLVTVHRPIQ